jgi:menaquinone-dependent protoporphyrinogen oxidase
MDCETARDRKLSVLVAYSSKHGATAGIAERIAETLRAAGLEAEARPVKSAAEVAGYDAFVVGSAVYLGAWMKDALDFVRSNQAVLADRPVWLFSSGPLGAGATDAEGRDLREVAEPTQLGELTAQVGPRGHRVFFGVLDPRTLGFAERAMRVLPAGRKLLPEGDFRDWADIDDWARSIVRELAPTPAGAASN